MKQLLIPALLAATLAPCFSAGASATEVSRDYQKSFEVDRGAVLRLRHGDGDVAITPWDRDVIEMTVIYRAEHKGFGDARGDFALEIREKNGIVEVIGRESREGFQPFIIYILKEYRYTISAPPWIALELNGDDGDVEIEKCSGPIEIRSDDGDISLFDCSSPRTTIRGEDGNITIEGHSGRIDIVADDSEMDIDRCAFGACRITAEDGRIRARDCQGDFEIERDDGETQLLRISTGVMSLRSADGGFDIELLESPSLDLDIGTDAGRVDLSLHRGISATFSVDVDDAPIRVDLPGAKNVQQGRRWMSGTLGNGRGKIRIRTGDGPVTLRELR
ncbi:MAG: DUF4097 family beta strand repeat-containing protein [Candidatus Krumholzibacteria bacterium]|nr:DUF4097 family beta strand repeat-containing protein [Candidatus Krumholzibacteria bacterium]